ncbi:FtsK/SpoIIIE domain-containing protein [Cryobacterium roopkundense]|uniref:S-DNA-T family DNA segregation ATPase FtsK/SpoIIIE n=1 Tax=Cryobacterium roopkundense TaxID=1001240 RepID=A0A7W9E2K6_9MICO|nr:FtsK/SpoIIIE domain-containing protein [Cryobacterium roopkundense]MBB5640223.1 S-DNA-T family DNA segregation ATPase FtsK/SpoIIIE [Cryobacterium roopkundense]
MTLAPLVAAAAIWFVTGSAFALIFAVLSPVIAVASMCDTRRSQRKRGAAERATYDEGIRVLRSSVTERHDLLRRTLRTRTPSVKTILAEPTGAGRWRDTAPTVITLGLGCVRSDLRIAGPAESAEHRELRLWAGTLTDAPIAVDARAGVGIVGPEALTRALARGIVVQLCFASPPTDVAIRSVPESWAWSAGLPHTLSGRCEAIVVRECGRPSVGAVQSPARLDHRETSTTMTITTAERLEDLPPGCGTVVRVDGPHRATVLASAVHAGGLEFQPELVSAEEAARFAAEARQQARGAGLLASGPSLPRSLAFSELTFPAAGDASGGAPAGLSCVLGRGESGDVHVDLVRAGPHAVIGGTTGSGKSELLITWVTSIAGAYSPAQVTFLLVDFKGGVAFRPLSALPHCVGLITDLDAEAAARTLASLSAELRYRERILRAAQATDVADPRVASGPTPLPRLVIVVDEFATMINVFPQLHALFVDVAARGRSLGMHLILCTQRPAGVVRDALLANCSLRVSLRVNNAADSQAVIGTDAAAQLSAEIPGRCLIAAASEEPRLCQVATAEEVDIRAASDRAEPAMTGSSSHVRRPWLDPLPPLVTGSDLAGIDDENGDGLLLGLLDEPERQRYRVARWNPATDGHLLVVGGARSGKSTLLQSLATDTRCTLIPADVEGTWDALARACRRLESVGPVVGDPVPAQPRVLLLDDLDAVCARWDPEHRMDALDMLTTLLRDGPAAQLFVVVCVQRLVGALQHLTATCENVLILRVPNAAEHQAAGGTAAQFDATLPPGGGRWRGLRVQLLCPDVRAAVPTRQAPPAAGPEPLHPLLVVTRASAGAAARWRSAGGGNNQIVDLTGKPVLSGGERLEVTAGGGAVIVLGDAEAWQTQWAVLAALRTRATLVFEGSSLADFRVVSRRRELPPPLAPGRGHVWALHPDGTVTRASLPGGPVV